MIFRLIADNFVTPIVTLLDTGITRLQDIRLVMIQGIDLGQYFGYLSFLTAPWLTLVLILVFGAAAVLVMWLVKVIHGLYLSIKQSILA